jgi:hypothetical protein
MKLSKKAAQRIRLLFSPGRNSKIKAPRVGVNKISESR